MEKHEHYKKYVFPILKKASIRSHLKGHKRKKREPHREKLAIHTCAHACWRWRSVLLGRAEPFAVWRSRDSVHDVMA